eukprot:TRINITY_DN637_c0_g1_i2.p2 TRINITY_DN637_c0_g1~~TRINITY_DN637_c0_g1_i2.p2  ORF type:complete len:106 (+),score=10.09 TRINITY_DN637_c0_g1_i2:486-803(+)
MKKIPMKSENWPKALNLTYYQVLAGKYLGAKLKTIKPNTAVPTALKQPIFKMSPANGATVSFGLKKSAATAWNTLKDLDIYSGPYFVAHGGSKIIVPPGTKLPPL